MQRSKSIRPKSSRLLDREIKKVLTKPPKHASAQTAKLRHHATRQSNADVWDVAMDAILEHDAARAAKIVKQIPGQPTTKTREFSHALEAAPDTVRAKFLELTEPKALKPSATAIAFFRKHAGFGVREGESKAKAVRRVLPEQKLCPRPSAGASSGSTIPTSTNGGITTRTRHSRC